MDLARKLNYSDKSVSKWGGARGCPDVYIPRADRAALRHHRQQPHRRGGAAQKSNPHFHIYVVLLSVALVFVIAAILFTAFTIAGRAVLSWLFFLYAVPVSSIVCIVFTSLWWGHSDAGAFHYGAHLVGGAVHLSLHPVDPVSEAHLRRLCCRAGAHHALGAVPLFQNKNMVLKRTFRARRRTLQISEHRFSRHQQWQALFRHQKSDRQSVWRRGMSAPATDLQLLQCK